MVHWGLPLQLGEVHPRGDTQITLFNPLRRRKEGTHELLGYSREFLALFTIGLHGLDNNVSLLIKAAEAGSNKAHIGVFRDLVQGIRYPLHIRHREAERRHDRHGELDARDDRRASRKAATRFGLNLGCYIRDATENGWGHLGRDLGEDGHQCRRAGRATKTMSQAVVGESGGDGTSEYVHAAYYEHPRDSGLSYVEAVYINIGI